MNEAVIQRLAAQEIQVTPTRILILKAMFGYGRAFTLADLEAKLETVDKSTISRAITLFRSKRLLHTIDDGSGSIKYALCHEDCDCGPEELHFHFHCDKCNSTICLNDIPVPVVFLPPGFRATSGNFVLKGICPDCNTSAT